MAMIVRNFIEYWGIADFLPSSAEAFKEFNVEETLSTPLQKPDIGQIIKVVSEVLIKGTRIIKTPKAVSLEGHKLTGWKLIIEGELKHKIEYIADGVQKSVHVVYSDEPFNTFIILPEDFKSSMPYNVNTYIVDSFAQQLNKRDIFHNTIILLEAELC